MNNPVHGNMFSSSSTRMELLKKEIWGLFKYGVVGGSSLAIHAGLYHVFSRILWVQGSRTMEYVLALFIASIYNFTFHRKWTFAAKGYSHQMVVRYVIVVLTSMGVQSIIFHIGVDIMHVYDYAIFGVSIIFATIIQYLGHRLFTFHSRFERSKV